MENIVNQFDAVVSVAFDEPDANNQQTYDTSLVCHWSFLFMDTYLSQ